MFVRHFEYCTLCWCDLQLAWVPLVVGVHWDDAPYLFVGHVLGFPLELVLLSLVSPLMLVMVRNMLKSGVLPKRHPQTPLRQYLKAEFFAYLPQSVMRFEYAKGYANVFVPIFRVGSSCIPVMDYFAYPKMHTPSCQLFSPQKI